MPSDAKRDYWRDYKRKVRGSTPIVSFNAVKLRYFLTYDDRPYIQIAREAGLCDSAVSQLLVRSKGKGVGRCREDTLECLCESLGVSDWDLRV